MENRGIAEKSIIEFVLVAESVDRVTDKRFLVWKSHEEGLLLQVDFYRKEFNETPSFEITDATGSLRSVKKLGQVKINKETASQRELRAHLITNLVDEFGGDINELRKVQIFNYDRFGNLISDNKCN